MGDIMRDEQILSALNELDRYRELLRENKNYLEECLRDENKGFIVNCNWKFNSITYLFIAMG